MVQDPRLKDVFPEPPLVAYKRPNNIKDKLVRSKVPPSNSGRPRREIPGMKKCNNCGVCPYVKQTKTVQATATQFKLDINSRVDCSSSNIIYLLGYKKCPQQYIGESERKLRDRFIEHKGYVNNKITSKSTGAHFNLKGHSSSDMEIMIIEKIFNNDPQFRKQREKMFIQKFNTKFRGLNKLNGG